MIYIENLTCNHSVNPITTGTDILLGWNYGETYERNVTQISFEITVSSDCEMKNVLFSSGTQSGTEMLYRLSSHMDIPQRTRLYWRVSSVLSNGNSPVSGVCFFETGIFDGSFWTEHGAYPVTPRTAQKNLPEALEFSRTFTIPKSKRIKSARAYVFGFGFTVLRVNGENPDGRMLAPSNSVYSKRSIYETYDITEQIKNGRNELSVLVGSGYNGEYSQYGYRYFGKIGFIALFFLDLENGETLVIPSDGKWSCKDSRIIRCGIYKGETYDASKTEFKKYPVTASGCVAPWLPDGVLIPREIPQITVTDRVTPVSARVTESGVIFDFGEVSSAVAEITVKAPRGTEVTLRHAEMILESGEPDYYTNRSAEATDVYICSGEGDETYSPSLTYHSFRYLLVSGLAPENIICAIKLKLSSDISVTGTFDCSDATLNRIHKLMTVAIRNNLFSIPTDCPVRDERTPCAMDSQVIEKSVMMNFGTADYYSKWLCDILDVYVPGESNRNPDWNGDFISLIWRIYRFYGDLRPAEKHFDTILAFFFEMTEKMRTDGFGKSYGDWCRPNNNTWEGFFGSAESVNISLLYGFSKKLAELGKILGKPAEVISSLENAEAEIEKHFKKLLSDGKIIGEEQTAMVMPLYSGLAKGADKDRIMQALLEKIKADGGYRVGIFGAMSLFELLGREGYADFAYELLKKSNYPGYGFLLARGATSLWEQWRYKGRMDSHSHGMFAGADYALYNCFSGINPETPGFSEVTLKPELPAGLTFTSAEILTPTGKIYVKTEILCGGFEMNVDIPVGCTARIVFPKVAENAEYVLFDGELQIELCDEITSGSGKYRFRKLPAEIALANE